MALQLQSYVLSMQQVRCLSPMFIFPRKRMESTLIQASPESVGYSNPNGWIDADLFVKGLEYFAASTNAYTENQQIIIMDGHHSHKTLAAIIQRHTTASYVTSIHTQPLDSTFFKSLQTAYNNSVDTWMGTN